MRKKTKHYPFPEKRKDIVLDEIIYPHGREKTDAEEMYWYKKLFSKEVRMLQAQYLILERELIETFEYVYPCDDHLDVYSAKYAQIIKGACNLFELIAHQIYNEIYVCDRIDILNFLTLDLFLDLKKSDLECISLQGDFSDENKIFEPFDEFVWDRESCIQKIPTWWSSYNEIKHSSSSYMEHANLKNALRAICAVAILLYKVYGPGVTIGKAQWYEIVEGEKAYYSLDNRISELFSNREGRILYTR